MGLIFGVIVYSSLRRAALIVYRWSRESWTVTQLDEWTEAPSTEHFQSTIWPILNSPPRRN